MLVLSFGYDIGYQLGCGLGHVAIYCVNVHCCYIVLTIIDGIIKLCVLD